MEMKLHIRITTHEHKGISRDPCQGTQMPNRMPWRIEEVKAPVPEIIQRVEVPDLDPGTLVLLKIHLSYLPPFKVRLIQRTILVFRIRGHERLLEPRPDDQRRTPREETRIPQVVPMPMAPDDGFDALELHVVLREDLANGFVDLHIPPGLLDALVDLGREVLPIFARAEVEEQFARGAGVFNEEGEGGTGEGVVAVEKVFEQAAHGNLETGRAVRGVGIDVSCGAHGANSVLDTTMFALERCRYTCLSCAP